MDDKPLNLVLPNRVDIEPELYEELIRQVHAITPTLRYDKDYQIRQLVTREFWRPLDIPTQIKLGKCLAYLEQQGLVPLVFVGCPRCSVKFYRRK
jgi:hypothetical protein